MKEIIIDNFSEMAPQVPQFGDKNKNYLIAGANPVYYLEEGGQEEQAAPLAASVDWFQLSTSTVATLNQSNQNNSFVIGDGISSVVVGQSFTTSAQKTLNHAKFFIKKVEGTPNSLDGKQITAYLFGGTGTTGNIIPQGSFLAHSDSGVIPDSLSTSVFTLVDFTFSSTPILQTNTSYVLAVGMTSAGDANNYLLIGSLTTGVSGNASYSTSLTVNWNHSSQNLIFSVLSGMNGTTINGNIVSMVSSSIGGEGVYAITDTSKVYEISSATGTINDLGYPSGGTVSGTYNYLALGGGTSTTGNLYATESASTHAFVRSSTSGTWTPTTGNLTPLSWVHTMEPFLDYIAVSDSSTQLIAGSLVKKLNMTDGGSIITGIDLGAGFVVLQMRNINNKYLAIAASKSSSGLAVVGYPQNYIFLWDGISARYQYAVKVPGKFIDMKVVDSVLYVAVQVSVGKTCVYYLSGTKLQKVTTTQLATIKGQVFADIPCSLIDFKNNLGIHLNDTNGLTDPLVVTGKDEIGNVKFIHSSGRLFDQFAVGFDGNLYANEYVAGGNSVVYYLPATGPYQTILYKSQWIPVKNLSAIDVFYDTPPASGTDAISVTIYGRGEDILTGSSTFTTANITPTNLLTTSRTRLDVGGFTGDKVKIQLSTTNTTWRPIIRQIKLILK